MSVICAGGPSAARTGRSGLAYTPAMDLRVCLQCGRGEPPPAVRCSGCGDPLQLRDEDWLVGQTLGNYRIERVVGSGGMGVVFGARHQALLREAAVKVLQPSLGSHGDTEGSDADAYARRFLREARVLATLDHPGIVGIYDFDVSPFGFPYLVMPLLRGETLRQLLDRHHEGLAPSWVAAILDDLAAALTHAHAHEVVHRDLKPENVFLVVNEGQARARLLDFGIAHGGHTTALDRTATGVLMGTPRYLAPEQLRGDAVSAATDQYSLALVAIELLTGRSVRGGDSLTEIMQRYATQPLPLDALPPQMPAVRAAALRRATDPQPQARFVNVAQFVAALNLPAPDRLGLAEALRIPAEVEQPSPKATVVLPSSGRASDAHAKPVSTPKPVVATHHPARSLKTWLAVMAAIVLTLAAVFWFGPWRDDASDHADTTGNPIHEDDWLRAGPTVPLVGSLEVLAQIDQTLVLRQPTGWALFDLETRSMAPGVTLARDEHLLGADDDQRLWLLHDGQVDALDAINGRRTPLIDANPALQPASDTRWTMATSGRWLARVDAEHFTVFHLSKRTARTHISGPAIIGTRIALGDTVAAVAAPRGTLQAWDLDSGKMRWQAPSPSFRVYAVAMAENLDVLAVATEEFILIFRLSDGEQLASLPFVATHLNWLADGPRLLAANAVQTRLWQQRASRFDEVQTLASGGSPFRGDYEIFSVDGSHLRRHEFGPRLDATSTGTAQVWAAIADAGHFYVGGAKPGLVRVAPGEPVLTRTVHDAGVTDLRIHDGQLISASDDRTLAVWRLPELDLKWRAKGHEFFINQIVFGASLWSSSSDGSLRRWRWPELEPVEDLALRPRVEPALELHALWAAADDSELLVGTWNDRLLRLRRQDPNWALDSAPFEAHTGYRMIDLPTLEAVLVVGITPGRMTLYDRRSGRLSDLPRDGHAWHAAVADATGSGVWLGGAGEIAHLHLDRRDDGRFSLRIAHHAASAFHRIGAIALRAARDKNPALLMLGNESGEALFLPPPVQNAAAVERLSDPPRAFESLR